VPTYEYECGKCGGHFDRFQSMTAPPVKRCPTCRGKVRRVPGTGAGVIFRGKGFYATDYRSPTYHSRERQESGAANGVGKAESKPPATGGKDKTESAAANTK
jgi:putative FmdB family regulatory protein